MVQEDPVNYMLNTMGNFHTPKYKNYPVKNAGLVLMNLFLLGRVAYKHVNLKTFSSICYLLELPLFSIINVIIIVMSVLLGDGCSQLPNFYPWYM